MTTEIRDKIIEKLTYLEQGVAELEEFRQVTFNRTGGTSTALSDCFKQQ